MADTLDTSDWTQSGGKFLAAPTRHSDPNEAPRAKPTERPTKKIAYNVFNLRMTQEQYDTLNDLRKRTGVSIQAHARRAIADYLFELRQTDPGLFAPIEGAPR